MLENNKSGDLRGALPELEVSEAEFLAQRDPPRVTRDNIMDGRSMRRTDRTRQMNIRAKIDTMSEIKRLVMRDDLASIANFLEKAVQSYKERHPEK
jgi:hypothetical protein